MDALSSSPHGVRLERFYSQPICTPTRSQAMSGRYQIHTGLQHGVLWSTVINSLPTNETTIAQHLKSVGYTTHCVGKWHLGHAVLADTPLRRGFDTFRGFWGGSEDHYSKVTGGKFDFREQEAIAVNAPAIEQNNASYSTHIFTKATVEVIEQAEVGTPFFVYLAFQATHSPLQAPNEVVSRFNATIKDLSRRTFAAMAAVVDEGVGNITAALKANGRYNNSVIFLSGDNGGQATAGGNNWPLRGWKGSLWEGGCRASAFVHSPLLPPRPAFVWHGLMHVSDWLPTTLELAGVPLDRLPTQLDGHAVWSALVAGRDSPRTELLHEIDRIAKPEFSCSGPFAPDDAGPAWPAGQDPFPAVHDRFVRAALHTVINGTHWKLVLGECAGWDTNSNNIPPPNWTPPPQQQPQQQQPKFANSTIGGGSFDSTTVSSAARGRCGVAPGCNGKNPMSKCPFVNGTWLFNLDIDPIEQCNLADAEPSILATVMERLNAYVPTEVPVRYPDGSPSLDPHKCDPPLSYWFAADEPGLGKRCAARVRGGVDDVIA